MSNSRGKVSGGGSGSTPRATLRKILLLSGCDCRGWGEHDRVYSTNGGATYEHVLTCAIVLAGLALRDLTVMRREAA